MHIHTNMYVCLILFFLPKQDLWHTYCLTTCFLYTLALCFINTFPSPEKCFLPAYDWGIFVLWIELLIQMPHIFCENDKFFPNINNLIITTLQGEYCHYTHFTDEHSEDLGNSDHLGVQPTPKTSQYAVLAMSITLG